MAAPAAPGGDCLLPRALEPVGPGPAPGSPSLRVLTWNLLADGLAQEGNFSRCPPGALTWEHRGPLIASALVRYDADVVVLQEATHLPDTLGPALEAAGYALHSKEKHDSACERMGYPADAVAVAWRRARLEPCGDARAERFAAEGGGEASQVLVAVPLRDTTAGGKTVLVVGAHLKAGKGSSAVREWQARQLAGRAGALGAGLDAQVVLGDFNAPPNEPALGVMAEAGFVSAWGVPPPGSHFTTWKWRREEEGDGEWEKRECIDYVLSRGTLSPVARWAQPAPEDIGEGALPCEAYPSDHIAQLTVLEWAA